MSALGELLTADDWTQITDGLCVGGATWSVEREGSGDGINAPIGATPTDPITAAVYRGRAPTLVVAQPGTPTPAAPWRLVVRSGTVQIGDVITSQADASWRFRITDLPDLAGDAIVVQRI